MNHWADAIVVCAWEEVTSQASANSNWPDDSRDRILPLTTASPRRETMSRMVILTLRERRADQTPLPHRDGSKGLKGYTRGAGTTGMTASRPCGGAPSFLA